MSSYTSSLISKLLEYLENGNNLIIKSRYEDILCEFDLLIASQLLIYYIGQILNVESTRMSVTS